MAERTPPHDEEAERSVLGAMMLSKAAVWDVLDVVAGKDFYYPKHEIVFDAIHALSAKDEPIDAITVHDELRRRGDLAKVGNTITHELTSATPTAANASYYAHIVHDKAVRRRTLEAATRILERGYSDIGEADALVEEARGELDAVLGGQRAEVVRVGAAFNQVVEELSTQPNVIETPWHEINKILVGLHPGRLVVVGARPGEGKTMVAAQLAMAMCRKGPVAYSSLEMTRGELLQRLISNAATVHMGSLERSHLTQDEWERVASIRPNLDALPLYVDDRSEVTITQIRAHARSVSRKGPLGGIVVDYLQLVSGVGDDERYKIVSEVSRQLKIMAKQFDCPVIALSQLKRAPQMQGKQRKPPTLEDLRESGTIEQDADVVILLQRGQSEDGHPDQRLRMHVAKNRHGRQGYSHLLWEGAYARVSSWKNNGQYELPIPD
ncbi:replicative DNA helicase [Herbiconiux sp.]|uniref:replicative DNA helicase n=1 Tax=Herbiconiux sp. TaxID=1871186 RepID=UPI0025C613EC|nr:replicative DNA helicase [Herbiconiux sp.]